MARCVLTWILWLAAVLGNTSASAGIVVEGVRAWAEPDSTRIVLDLNAAGASHSLFTLSKPDRVVIDIAGAELDNQIDTLPAGVGMVRAVRAGRQAGDHLRIVLDLERAARVRSFFAGPSDAAGERLVIDLGERARQAPVKRAAGGQRDIVIAVDPGHGGHDPGAIGKNRTYEKDVVLAIGLKLVKRINQAPGMTAFLIRDRDVYVDFRDRSEAARKRNADLFISIHADAVEDRRAFGSSVYTLSMKGATDEAAHRLAATQNVSLIGGVSLDDKAPQLAEVLMDLSMNATINASLDVGAYVLEELGRVNRLHRRTVQQAGFIVLKSPDVPSILVETAYISNPDEERKLKSDAHQRKLADAIYSGVHHYFSANPPVDTIYARGPGSHSLPRTHTIAAGDTLSEIADLYRVSVAQLRRANRLPTDQIRIGQVLTIPTGG